MIHRGPGFLEVVSFGSSPAPFPPLLSSSCFSFLFSLWVAGRAYWRGMWGGGGGKSKIIRSEYDSLPPGFLGLNFGGFLQGRFCEKITYGRIDYPRKNKIPKFLAFLIDKQCWLVVELKIQQLTVKVCSSIKINALTNSLQFSRHTVPISNISSISMCCAY